MIRNERGESAAMSVKALGVPEKLAAAAAAAPSAGPKVRPQAASGPSAARRPRHVAIILDGNGRWASAKGLPRLAGHVRGVEAVRETLGTALERGIEVLTLYAFSVLNWRRPAEEVQGLMRLLEHYLAGEGPRLAEQGVRLRLLGDPERLPEKVRAELARAEANGGANGAAKVRLAFNLAINYGGREEIVEAVRRLAGQVLRGTLRPQAIDAPRIERQLFTRALPPVDLLIRTAGERRISNFLLWQSAYAELCFMDVLWPDFTSAHFDAALADYARRRRTFGGLHDRGTPRGTQAIR